MTEYEREDIEDQILILENDILPDLKESLAYLTSPDYDPAKNADHNLREQDIEFYEDEIAKTEREIASLKRRLERGS